MSENGTKTLLEHDSLTLDEAVLRRQVEILNNVTETPQFHGLIDELRAAPANERRDLAKKIEWVNELKNGGVEVPAALRMTERAFEDPSDGRVAPAGDFVPQKVAEQPQMGGCVSIGYYVCVSYG